MKKSGKNLTIQWLKYALLDLRDIREYISQDNPEAAGNVIFTIIDTIGRLAMFSEMGKPGRVKTQESLLFPDCLILSRIASKVRELKFFVFYIRRESFLKDYK